MRTSAMRRLSTACAKIVACDGGRFGNTAHAFLPRYARAYGQLSDPNTFELLQGPEGRVVIHKYDYDASRSTTRRGLTFDAFLFVSFAATTSRVSPSKAQSASGASSSTTSFTPLGRRKKSTTSRRKAWLRSSFWNRNQIFLS